MGRDCESGADRICSSEEEAIQAWLHSPAGPFTPSQWHYLAPLFMQHQPGDWEDPADRAIDRLIPVIGGVAIEPTQQELTCV